MSVKQIQPNTRFKNLLRTTCKPVSTDPIYLWAKKNVVLPKAYAVTGPFDVNKSKYLIEPFTAIKDKNTRMVVCAAAVQSGKTLLADISIPWFLINRPGPIQFSQATDTMVKDHVNNRLYPLMHNVKPLKAMLPPNDKEYTNTGIRFPHCTLYANGEKESAFQAKSIMFAICDEVWLWDRGRLPEAIARVSAFDAKETSKVLIISQPGEVGDDFDNAYNAGTQEEWCVPCEKCGMYFFPEWRPQKDDGSFYGMMWDSNDTTKPDGKWNLPEVYKTIRYECGNCGHKHIDSKKLKNDWNRRGKYIQRNASGNDSCRSFRWNSIICRDWKLLVEEFIQAKELSDVGIKENVIKFFQKRITQTYDPNFYSEIGFIKTDVYDVDEAWPDEVVRFMTIDCQKHCFWVNIRAWAADGRSKQIFFGEASEAEIHGLLTRFKVPRNNVFVDIGNTEKQEDTGRHLVLEFVDRNQFTGLRGDHWASEKQGYEWTVAGHKVKLFYSKPQGIANSPHKRWYYNFAPEQCRDVLKELRDGKRSEFLCLDNQEYKKQMFAERKMPVKNKYGEIRWCWKNPGNKANHAWDCEVMQVVATLIHPGIHLIPKPM